MLGEHVEVTILDAHSGEIKLGINAPRSVVILRKEIFTAVQSENRLAAQSKLPSQGLDVVTRKLRKL